MKHGLFSFVLVLIALLSSSHLAAAQTLLVSDVDDTIKLAHVQSYRDMAYYAFDETRRFMGMSELYNLVAQDNPDLEIVYLSRAPTWIMQKRHQAFLKKGRFPEGRYMGRSDLPSETHKLESLRRLIAEFSPKKVILIGDNGEADPAVYRQISQELRASGIEFFQFIRIVYSKSFLNPVIRPLAAEQIGFVTPVEMALDLESHGFLKKTSLENLLASQIPDLANEKQKEKNGNYAFPYFVECQDFRWMWDSRMNEFPALSLLKARIVKRCGLMP